MRKGSKEDETRYEDQKTTQRSSRKRSKTKRSRGTDKARESKSDSAKSDNPLVVGGRDNDPNWYFTDRNLADQVSRLSFNNLAGFPVAFSNVDLNVPNIVRIEFNPSAGVIEEKYYASQMLNKNNGVNLAGFKLFSKLSAYTGRVATYGPQDISTMILALGEVLSCMEWIRRVFGVAYVMSMRNRSYPRELLSYGMLVDADDLFENMSDYRTRFNTYVTMVNQIPIPQGIAYFEKCMSIYQRIYLDNPSSMAQTLVPNPYTTWILDEQSYQGGSILKTLEWHGDETLTNKFQYVITSPRKLGDYLDLVDSMISALLNSSTLQVVYTDLLNLSQKIGVKFWALDYLLEGYQVLPDYNEHFSLMAHNSTICGMPCVQSVLSTSPNVTPYNDVYPNNTTNSLYYNPVWHTMTMAANGLPRTGLEVLLDMLTDQPTVEDMVEVTRYTSIGGVTHFGSNNQFLYDAILPDHYVVMLSFSDTDPNAHPMCDNLSHTLIESNYLAFFEEYLSQLDWAPHVYGCNVSTGAMTGEHHGDMNYYTVATPDYLRRLHQFMTLGLYDIRS